MIYNIYIVFKALAYLIARILRYAFHLNKPHFTFAQYIRGDKTEYGYATLLNIIVV